MSTFNVKPNEQLIELIKIKFSYTSLSRCNINWFIEDCQEYPNRTIVELVLDHLTGDTVLAKSTFDVVATNLKAIANDKRCDPKHKEALLEALVLAKPFREEKDDVKPRKSVVPSREFVKTYIDSLDTTSQKVLAWLTLRTGVTPCDLIRDTHQMKKLSEGVINVGKKLNKRHAGARLITFDPTELNQLDPDGEHQQIFRNKAFDASNVGEMGATEFSSILNGTPYNFYQLRASYAIHRRNEDEADWQTICDELGVSGVSTFVQRIKAYADANGIELK